MPRTIALSMYTAPVASLEAFWRGLRGHMLRQGLTHLPDALAVPDNFSAHWRSPDLLLGQTCGFPLVTSLAGQVRYVGTPCYRAPGCEGPFYSSALLVRADEAATDLAGMRGCRVAFNNLDSQSGYNGLRALVAPLARAGRFFAAAVETGAHRLSVEAVRGGAADIAAVDAVTYALLRRDSPAAVAGLRVLAFSDKAPGLPLITALGTSDGDLQRLRAAFAAACADPALAEARDGLLLDGFEVLPPPAYDEIRAMQNEALAFGYPELA